MTDKPRLSPTVAAVVPAMACSQLAPLRLHPNEWFQPRLSGSKMG